MGIAMIAVLDTFTHTEAIQNYVHSEDGWSEGRYPDIIRIISSTIEQVTRLMTHPCKLLTRRLTARLLIRYQRKGKKYPDQVSTSTSIGYTRILALLHLLPGATQYTFCR